MKTKKPQLRRCAFCQKPGHNKTTCPLFLSSQKAKPAPSPLKFFIHHTTGGPAHSPHLINLKNAKTEIWDRVETAKPRESATPLYHFYHELEIPKRLDEPTARQAKITAPKFNPLEQPKIKKQKRNIKILDIKDIKILKNKLISNIQYPISRAKSKLTFLNNFSFKLNARRLASAIILFALILIVPGQARTYYQDLKQTTQKIAESGTGGFLALQESTAALLRADLLGARASLTAARQNLNEAVATMNKEHRVLQAIVSVIPVVGGEVQSRQKIILAGQKIAAGNAWLLSALNSETAGDDALTSRLRALTAALGAAIPSYEGALADLSAVKTETLPLPYQAPFKDFRLLFTALLGDLKNLNNLGQSFQEIFGGEGRRRYLLVFQNPHELRPTGGFMGSFALLDVKDGQIVKMDVPAGGTYDLQGQLSEYVEPPAPLLLSNKRWEFQDANWFPDFPKSAEKMIWFLRKSRGMSADGVIALNATVLERLLAITGPVTDEKRELTLTSENAVTAIQKIVEEGPEKQARKPKQILADLAPKFLAYFKNIRPENLLPLLANLQEALTKKEIQAYFADEGAENSVKSFGWGGQILSTREGQDYLMVVNANIQGQKSDAKIKQTVEHQTVVDEEGQVTNTVTITREHTGAAGEKLYGVTNIDYLRVYAPLGSELISASGFSWPDEGRFRVPDNWFKKDTTLLETEKEIKVDRASGTRVTEEFGKTAFGNWIITEPGATSQIQFVYRLPFKIARPDAASMAQKWKEVFADAPAPVNYQLVVQRQSGAASDFESQIVFPETWRSVWSEGPNLTRAANGALINKMPLEQDAVWSLLMTKN